MINRCVNKKSIRYEIYGGRGIKVCDRWLFSFENFVADMGERPPGMTLERKDNDGNYEPDNCKWATAKEQQNHRRNNHVLFAFGISKNVTQWAEEYGISAQTIFARIKLGWLPERAISEKVHFRGQKPRANNLGISIEKLPTTLCFPQIGGI